jgi:hypothetical protein
MFTSSSPTPMPVMPIDALLEHMAGDVVWWVLGVVLAVGVGLAIVASLAKWRS